MTSPNEYNVHIIIKDSQEILKLMIARSFSYITFSSSRHVFNNM